MEILIFHKNKRWTKKKRIENSKRDLVDSILTNDLKSIEKSRQFIKLFTEILKDFVKTSEGYSNKLSNILSKLSYDEIHKKKINDQDEIQIFTYIQKTLKIINDKINKMVNKINKKVILIESEKNNIVEIYTNLSEKKNENLNKFQKHELLNDTLNTNYIREFGIYEDYLINKNLNALENNNTEQDDNQEQKKEKEKKDKNENENSNLEKVKEAQEALLNQIKVSNSDNHRMLKPLFTENYSFQQKIFEYSDFFVESINEGFFGEKENENINELKKLIEKEKNMNENVENRIEKEENKILFIMKYYSLKCLSNEENETTKMVKELGDEKVLNIINEIKNNGLLLNEGDEIKIEEVSNKVFIQKNIDLLFDDNYGTDIEQDNLKLEDEKNNKAKMINLFKLSRIYRIAFIQHLNNIRARGHLNLNKRAGNILGNYLITLNNLVVNEKDYYLFKLITLLSVTYYYTPNNDDSKIYLSKFIQNCYEFTNKQFWTNYLKEIINKELEGNEEIKKPIMEYSYDDIKNFKSKKVHICIYSNIFSLTKVMTDLDLKKDFIIDWLNNVVDNTFYLEETEKNEIINLLNNEES